MSDSSSSVNENIEPAVVRVGIVIVFWTIMATPLLPSGLEKIMKSFRIPCWKSFGVRALTILLAVFLPKHVSPQKEVLQIRAAIT